MIDKQREQRQKAQHPWGRFRGHERWRTKEKELTEQKRDEKMHRMESSKKGKRTGNNLLWKKILRPCLQQLENYRGGNVWWRTTAEGGPEELSCVPELKATSRRTLDLRHTNAALLQNWSSTEKFHLFFLLFQNSSEMEEKERMEIKAKDNIVKKKREAKRKQGGSEGVEWRGAGRWITFKKLGLAFSPSII